MKPEIFVSVDVETNGPIPSPFSMLSLGAVAFSDDGGVLSTFSSNLDLLPEDPGGDPDTMGWWSTQPPEAWKACRDGSRPPASVMGEFVLWVESLGGDPVCVCYPSGFDFTFIYQYLIRFAGRSPFGYQALDIRSYAAAHLGVPFRKASMKNMPSSWTSDLPPHTHVALDDAMEQGHLFMRIRAEVLRR